MSTPASCIRQRTPVKSPGQTHACTWEELAPLGSGRVIAAHVGDRKQPCRIEHHHNLSKVLEGLRTFLLLLSKSVAKRPMPHPEQGAASMMAAAPSPCGHNHILSYTSATHPRPKSHWPAWTLASAPGCARPAPWLRGPGARSSQKRWHASSSRSGHQKRGCSRSGTWSIRIELKVEACTEDL